MIWIDKWQSASLIGLLLSIVIILGELLGLETLTIHLTSTTFSHRHPFTIHTIQIQCRRT